MKVLFNAFCVHRLRTGVGCYAKNLLDELQIGGPTVDAFPTGFLATATRLGSSLLKHSPSHSNAATHFAPKSIAFRRTAKHLGRSAGRKLAELAFRRASRSETYDLYHEPNFIPWPCDIPAVATVHDLSAVLHPEWHPADRTSNHQRHFERGLRSCAHVIADSEFVRQQIVRHFGLSPRRVSAVHLGVARNFRPLEPPEVAPTLARLNLPSSYLLYVGTIEPRKNLLTLLRAFCDIPHSMRTACPLVLVGPWGWNCTREREFFQSHGRQRGVVHLGYVADGNLPAIYNGARALVYPSYYEGFGLPPIEMMACGGPVLASTAAAVREVCGRHAHFIDPADLVGWRDNMAKVITDKDWHAELSAGVCRYAARYTWRKCAEHTFSVYDRITGRNRQPVRSAA